MNNNNILKEIKNNYNLNKIKININNYESLCELKENNISTSININKAISHLVYKENNNNISSDVKNKIIKNTPFVSVNVSMDEIGAQNNLIKCYKESFCNSHDSSSYSSSQTKTSMSTVIPEVNQIKNNLF